MTPEDKASLKRLTGWLRKSALETCWSLLEQKYRPDQLRILAGEPGGGRWADEGGGDRPPGTDKQKKRPMTAKEIDSFVVGGHKAGKFGGVGIDFNLPYPQEQLWAVYEDGETEYLGVHGTARGDVGESRATPSRPDYRAIVHTHPDWASLEPGPKDRGFSVPLYGIGRDGVWVVRPRERRARRLQGADPYGEH